MHPTATASQNGAPFKYSEAALAEIKGIMAKFPEGKHKSAILRALHIAQEEHGGWLSAQTMDEVAAALGIAPIEVYEVATFYSMYNHEPVGKYVLEFCHTGPCAIEGAEKLIEYVKLKLGIGKNGQSKNTTIGIKV